MKTTDTAEGTATRGSVGKCCCARRKPSAADCMPVSIDTCEVEVRVRWSRVERKGLGARD